MSGHDFLELKYTKPQQDSSPRKFVYIRSSSYYLDMRESNNSRYLYLEKGGEVISYKLVKSINKRAREGGSNILIMSTSAKNNLQPAISSMVRRIDWSTWNIAYTDIRGTDLYGTDGRRINVSDLKFNVAVVIAYLLEVVSGSLKVNLRAHTVVALTCRIPVLECAIKMLEYCYDDETIRKTCDPAGRYREIIELGLKMAKAVTRGSRPRCRNPTNTMENNDEFLVRKLLDAGFMAKEYYVNREGFLYFDEAIYYTESFLKNEIPKKRGREL